MQITPAPAHGKSVSMLGSLAGGEAGGDTPVPQVTPGTMVRLESASHAMAGLLLQSAAKGAPGSLAEGEPALERAPSAALPAASQQTAPAPSGGLASSSHDRSPSSFGFWKRQQQGQPSQVESQTVSYGGFFQLPPGQAAPSTAATAPAPGLDCQQTVSFTGFLQQQDAATTAAAASTPGRQQAAAAAGAAAQPAAAAAGDGLQATAGGPGFRQFFSGLKAGDLPEQGAQQVDAPQQQLALPAIRTSSLSLQQAQRPASSADNTPHSRSQAVSFAFAAAQPEVQSCATPTSTQVSPFAAASSQQHQQAAPAVGALVHSGSTTQLAQVAGQGQDLRHMQSSNLAAAAAPQPAPGKKASAGPKRLSCRKAKPSPQAGAAAGLSPAGAEQAAAAMAVQGPAGVKKPARGSKKAAGKGKAGKDAAAPSPAAAAAMGQPPGQQHSFTAMLAGAIGGQPGALPAQQQPWQQQAGAPASQGLTIAPLHITSAAELDLAQLMKDPVLGQALADHSPKDLFNDHSLHEFLHSLHQTPQKGRKGEPGSRPSSAGLQLAAAALKHLKSPDKSLDDAVMAALMRDGDASLQVRGGGEGGGDEDR
jgi:hypothetical protein